MDGVSDLDAHFWLTRSVARTVGLNLGKAMEMGQITPQDYARMVARCRESGCAERCAEWLGRQQDGRTTEPPPFCRHHDQFRALRLT